MKTLIHKASITLFSIGVFSTLTPINIQGQNVTANARLDSMQIFIGSQLNLTLEVSYPKGTAVVFPIFTDTISKSVEVVERGKIDTISTDNNRIELRQIYRITSFDSGVHLIPAIQFGSADDTAAALASTKEMALKVMNPFDNVDPEKGIFDIKQPINTPFSFAELLQYWPYFAGFLLLIALIAGFLIWKFNRKLLSPILGKEKPLDPPHVIALRELERIKNEHYSHRGLEKLYYSEITDVLRRYIETRFHVPALEQTTEEILTSLKPDSGVDNTCLANLQQLLQIADLVKFAKHQPLPDENDLSMMHAVFFINQTKIEEVKSIEEQKAMIKE